MLARVAMSMCLSVCLSVSVSVTTRWTLPSTYPTLCCKEIQVTTKMKVLSLVLYPKLRT